MRSSGALWRRAPSGPRRR
uniref:Uncharacterized protein n=1 Tax=Arundo donax TaxID=35708 RepID=A0A0A9B7Q6_ARUDO